MRTPLLLYILTCLSPFFLQGQLRLSPDTSHFNYSYWTGVADKMHLVGAERRELLETQRNLYIQEQLHAHDEVRPEDLVWVNNDSKLIGGGNNINAGPCTNIDFENGFTGWTRTTGYNPLTNAIGCCPNPNGDQTIMTGGVDPFGNFPRVWPGGGGSSLRLGSTAIGGLADRVSQTFFVTPANANFTYRYAVVLNDPGHTPAQQPRFMSEIIDTLGNPVNCTVYSVTAGGGIPGFQTSTLTANGSTVIYKNWTNVAVDLTPNIGQNVTIRFTVFDCSPTGHFAYAYLDGICTNFATNTSDTTCANIPINICAPTGFSTTTWNGPGVINNPNQCINIVQPGTYSCTTLLVPGCPGPTFIHTLTLLPSPVVSFTPVSGGFCARQYTFNGAMSISGGSITSYQWFFGDGTSSSGPINQIHNYAAAGTYSVKLRAVSNRGCADSVIVPITIYPLPNLSFSPPSNCVNTVVQFTNTSNISVGSISGYTWNLGNGATSNLVNPTNSYTTNGTYTITLDAVSNMGCAASLTQTLGIFPPPVIGFTANPLCDANGTSFTPITSTAIASGSLATFFWDFGDGSTSNLASPIHIYNAPGLYTVNFSALSNHNCPASFTNTFIISPSPTVAIITNSINACSNTFTFASNSSISAGTLTHTWNLGGGLTSTLSTITHTFPGVGNYTVTLIGTSNLGCGDTAVQYITIYPPPVINFSVPASCENAIFGVTTTATSGSVTSYNWDFGDPGSGAANTSTLQNPTHYYQSTGNYTITLNLLSNLNCPSTTITPITVFPNPSSLFTYTSANNCALPYTFVQSSTVSNIGASFINSYNWNFGPAGSSTLANPGVITFPGNGSYSVSLIVGTNHNCKDTLSTTINVHPLPYLTFTMNPDCVGEFIPVTESHSISPIPSPGSSISSYTWNFGNGVTSSLQAPPPQTYTASGIYTITLGGTSNMGCSSSLVHTLQVYPNPVIDFTTVSTMCYGFNTNFTSTTSVSTGTIVSYAWDFGDGTTGLGQNLVHTYTASGTYAVNFSVTTNYECTTVLTKTITIYPLPAVSFTANGGCLNVVSQFVNTSSISIGSIGLYAWNFGDGSTSNSVSPNHTYTVQGTYTPTLIATSSQGCQSFAVYTVVIHPLPNVVFASASVCVGTAIQFTNMSSVSPGGIISYTWDFADGGSSNLMNPVHAYTTAGTYNTTLTATTNQSCVSSGTNNLLIKPYPNIAFNPVQNSCTSGTAVVQPSITITGTNNVINSYSVSFGDGSGTFTSSTTGIPVNHVYTSFGTFSVGVTALSNGCASSSATNIVVYARPVPNFISSGFCYNSPSNFANTSTIAPTYSINAYQWYFGNGTATSTLTNPSYVFSGPGIYSVQLTALSYPEAGLTCSLSTTKTININPLAGVSFSANTVCQGNPTTFSNTTNQGNVIAWSWYFYSLNLLQSTAPQSSFTYSAPGTYTAYLVAQTIAGCRDTASNLVTVNPNPVSSFVSDSVCLGIASSFTANSTIIPGGIISNYLWNFGNGNTANGIQVNHVFGTAGTHTTELSTLSNYGCVNKITLPVIVHPKPSVNFNANAACLGDTTQFINLSGIQSGTISSFVWNFGNGNFSTQSNPITFYAASGTYSVKLDGVSDHQCSSSITKTVIVYENPKADFFVSGKVCYGELINLVNLSSSQNGSIVANFWDFNNDGVTDNTSTNGSTSYTILGNTSIKLSVQSQYGCVNSKTLTVFVNPKPTVAFTSPNKSGCPTFCVKFNNQSVISTGSISSYHWEFGDGGPSSSQSDPNHCYTSGLFSVTLTAVSDSGCVSKLVHPDFIKVYDMPEAGFNVVPEQVDENEPLITVYSAASGASLTKYYINDGSTYLSKDFSHTFQDLSKTLPMIVQVVVSSNGCSDTTFKVLEIKPAFAIYFPNTFTPNEDGINDTYQPKGIGISKFNLWIFDRWGHLVFETDNIYNQWDGHTKGSDGPIKQDVYNWKAKVIDIFNKPHEYAGHVSLIR
ncbi:MAG TPA: PKD domain-containing protein [Bacteroidia bacterium]|nr:PKD domain-containing protein [Bacteroidia bacterium]